MAQAWGGFNNLGEVAQAIGEDGLKVDTLQKIVSGKRPCQPSEAAAIAAACGVPVPLLTDVEYDPFSEPVSASDLFERLDQIGASLEHLQNVPELIQQILSADILRRAQEAAQVDPTQPRQSTRENP